jgi:hypothetical protein
MAWTLESIAPTASGSMLFKNRDSKNPLTGGVGASVRKLAHLGAEGARGMGFSFGGNPTVRSSLCEDDKLPTNIVREVHQTEYEPPGKK